MQNVFNVLMTFVAQYTVRRLASELVGGDMLEFIDFIQQHGRLLGQVLPL